VQAQGGTAVLTDSYFEHLSGWPGRRSEPATAIRTTNTDSTIIARNVISGVTVMNDWWLQQNDQPESPYCSPMPGSAIGIASNHDQSVQITGNTLDTLRARGIGGYAQALSVQEAQSVTVTHNSIVSVTGGSASHSAGIQISQTDKVLVDSNRLGSIRGSSTPPFGYGLDAVDGGSATGIGLLNVEAAPQQDCSSLKAGPTCGTTSPRKPYPVQREPAKRWALPEQPWACGFKVRKFKRSTTS
jgi:hypothetical protein